MNQLAKASMKRLKTKLMLFSLNFASYFLIAANMRAIAQANYLAAAVTDFSIALLGATLVKKLVEAKSLWDSVAFAAGGTTGALIAIHVTKMIFGK